MATPLEVSVNLRASQPEGRFYMPLEEALDLYNGGLAQAILDAVEKLERDVEYGKQTLQARQSVAKRARQALTNSNIK